MLKFAIAAIAAIVATPALGQTLKGTIETLTGWPIDHVTSLNRPDATEIKLPDQRGWAPRLGSDREPSKVLLRYEPGGRIDVHTARFQELARRGDQIEVRGLCQSACTLVLGYVPLDRICFGDEARLNFHKASNADGTVSVDYTITMVSKMPLDIQTWIEKRGGYLQMPHASTCTLEKNNCFWTLPARELWKMGYRRCD